jgi:hypothetical protein
MNAKNILLNLTIFCCFFCLTSAGGGNNKRRELQQQASAGEGTNDTLGVNTTGKGKREMSVLIWYWQIIE